MATKMKQSQAAVEMSSAALMFLESLTPDQRAKATFDYGDAERIYWCHAPVNQRGISLKEMSDRQRNLAYALMASGLAEKAFQQAEGIIDQESKYWGQPETTPSKPHIGFGQPGGAEPWGWRAQGHHLSLNFSIFQGEVIATTPLYFGALPLSLLAASQDLAFELMASLDAGQRSKAIINSEAPWDILTFNASRPVFMPNEGLPATKMTATQKEKLIDLITEPVSTYPADRLSAELGRA